MRRRGRRARHGPLSRSLLPTRNLALATVAFALCFSTWGLIAPLAKKFQDELDLTSTETLFLTAVPVILGSLFRIPVGLLTDRYGGRRMFSLLLAVSAVPAILFGYATGYWALVGVGFLLGVAGSSFAIGVPFVSGWYRIERQGLAVGIYGMGNIGTAVAAFTAPAVVNTWGRPTLGWATGLILLGGAAVFWLGAVDPPRGEPSHYREVLASGWRLYRLAVFYFVTFGGFVALALLLPKLLVDWFDLSLVDAGLRAAGFTVAATFARPVGGWLSDRFGAYPVLVLAFAGIAVDAAVLAAIAPTPRIVPITIACLSLAVLPRHRERRRVQARTGRIPERHRRGGRARRHRGWARRLLPTPRHGCRQRRDGELHAGLRRTPRSDRRLSRRGRLAAADSAERGAAGARSAAACPPDRAPG